MKTECNGLCVSNARLHHYCRVLQCLLSQVGHITPPFIYFCFCFLYIVHILTVQLIYSLLHIRPRGGVQTSWIQYETRYTRPPAAFIIQFLMFLFFIRDTWTPACSSSISSSSRYTSYVRLFFTSRKISFGDKHMRGIYVCIIYILIKQHCYNYSHCGKKSIRTRGAARLNSQLKAIMRRRRVRQWHVRFWFTDDDAYRWCVCTAVGKYTLERIALHSLLYLLR